MVATRRSFNPWAIFALASVAQFMVVLDASIMNVALPSIRTALHFSLTDLQWVINIYVLIFGGFLLLGGRAGDLFGRRRLFIIGLLLFSAASLAGGLAQNGGWLVAARGFQGLGGAIISPVALAIVTSTFTEGAERNRAIGLYGALAGVGGAAGVLLGGILTSSFGWEWVLFVNVPVGVVAAAIAPRLLPDNPEPSTRTNIDFLGAAAVTAGLVSLVYGLVKAPENGWTSGSTLGFFLAAVLLLAGFVVIELRSANPLVRLGIFRTRSLTVADTAGGLAAAGMFAMFYFLSLYLQIVLGFSPLKTGIAYLPLALTIIVSAGVASVLVTRFGPKPVMATGLILAAVGMVLLTRIPVAGHYTDVLFAMLIFAAGLGCSFVPLNIAAVAGVAPAEVGLASGLVNTFMQVGGALGLAVLSTISTSHFNDLIRTGHGPLAYPTALVGGFHYAFGTGAALMVAGAVLILLLMPRPSQAQIEAEEDEPEELAVLA